MEALKLFPQSEGLLPALVPIPAGSFLMGSDVGQDNEKPVHRVWVEPFLLAACQVTNADFARFLRDAKSLPRQGQSSREPAYSRAGDDSRS